VETPQGADEEPSPLDWASVSGQAPVKIVTPYSFTPADEAAEAVVLGELAVLGEQGLAPWAAADHLFNRAGLPPVFVGHRRTQKPSVAGEEADPVSV
jgi:hypothetical protein